MLARTLILAGLALVGAYIWEAVIMPWGQPDQSLLYWYAFLPLSGAIPVRAGIRMPAGARKSPDRPGGRS